MVVTKYEQKWLERLFGTELSKVKRGDSYYFANLYDLFYQNKDKFNNGDWFGEFYQAIAIGLRKVGLRKFQSNAGRMYLWKQAPKDAYFPWEEIKDAAEFWAVKEWELPEDKSESIPHEFEESSCGVQGHPVVRRCRVCQRTEEQIKAEDNKLEPYDPTRLKDK